jgi:hypothetical protein
MWHYARLYNTGRWSLRNTDNDVSDAVFESEESADLFVVGQPIEGVMVVLQKGM